MAFDEFWIEGVIDNSHWIFNGSGYIQIGDRVDYIVYLYGLSAECTGTHAEDWCRMLNEGEVHTEAPTTAPVPSPDSSKVDKAWEIVGIVALVLLFVGVVAAIMMANYRRKSDRRGYGTPTEYGTPS